MQHFRTCSTLKTPLIFLLKCSITTYLITSKKNPTPNNKALTSKLQSKKQPKERFPLYRGENLKGMVLLTPASMKKYPLRETKILIRFPSYQLKSCRGVNNQKQAESIIRKFDLLVYLNMEKQSSQKSLDRKVFPRLSTNR